MLMAHRTTHNGRRYSLGNKAKALAVILREEFDTAFVCYDAATGLRIGSSEIQQQTSDTWVALEASTVGELTAAGRAQVTLLPYHRYELAIKRQQGDMGSPCSSQLGNGTRLQGHPGVTRLLLYFRRANP